MLLHLEDEQLLLGARADALALDLAVGRGALDGQGAVDLGQLVGEHDIDHHAGDLVDTPDVATVALALLALLFCGSHFFSCQDKDSPPATTSMISCVISAWRARFISKVRSSMSSPAFSDALRIAVMRALCSEAVLSSRAR